MRSNRTMTGWRRAGGLIVVACGMLLPGCGGLGGYWVRPVETGAAEARIERVQVEPAQVDSAGDESGRAESVGGEWLLRGGESVVVPFAGGRFRFESRSGKILLWVENTGGASIQLSERTSVTDAAGRMRFYAGQSVAAGGAGRLVIPPAPGASELVRRRDASESRGGPFEGGIYPDQRALDEVRAPSGRFIWPRGAVIRLDVVIERANDAPIIRTFNLRHAS